MKAILGLLFLCLAGTVSLAQVNCPACDEAGKARSRGVIGKGAPDPRLVCFDVSLTHPNDSVAVTVSYQGRQDWTQTLPVGAAQRFGTATRPAVCIPRSKVVGATSILAIPGSKEACGKITGRHIVLLYRGKMTDVVCLEARCNGIKIP